MSTVSPQPISPHADVPLVERAGRGDRAALRSLYDRYASRVMALALRVLGSTGEAEEIVQETFLEVWRRAREYEAGRSAPSTWITTIGRSRAIDRLRARGSGARAAAASAFDVRADLPTPLEDAERRVARERICAALDALPAEQRLTIELAYYQGLTQREIAERTGEPLGTIKTRVRLAFEKLAVALEGLR